MNPSRARSRLTAYLEDDLSPRQRARVAEALERSPELRRELADLEATVALLRAVPQPEPPSFLAERVIARVRAGEAERVSRLERLTSWLELRYAVPVAAAAVALAVWVGAPLRASQPGVSEPAVAIAEGGPMAVAAPVAEIAAEARRVHSENLMWRVRRDGMVGILRGAGHPHSADFASHLEGADDVALVSFERR